MIIEILVAIIALCQLVQTWLSWQLLSPDKQHEIERKIIPPKGTVLKWEVRQEPEKEAFEDTLMNRITK